MLAKISRYVLVNTNDVRLLQLRPSEVQTWEIVLETNDGKERILASYPDKDDAKNTFNEIKGSLNEANCLIDICPK